MPTGLDDLNWKPPSTAGQADVPLYRRPVRALMTAAAFVLVVTSLFPWAEGADSTGAALSIRPTQGTAEGVWMIPLAIALIVLCLNRSLADSRSRSVQLAPMVIAAVTVVLWVTCERTARDAIALWVSENGSGEETILVPTCAAAIVVIALCAVWLYARRPAIIRSGTVGVAQEWPISRRVVLEGAGAVLGGITGATLGVVGGLTLTRSPGGALLLILAVPIGVVLGGRIGGAVVRRVLRRR